jgi:hypothetical protein
MFLQDGPNRFSLPTPSRAWCQTIFNYDPELVIFRSQEKPYYCLARRAKRSGGLTGRFFGKLPFIKPDTKTLVLHGLVPVTVILKEAITQPAERIVEVLRRRDQWAAAGGNTEAHADRLVDSIEAQEAAARRQLEASVTQGVRDRARAMRSGYLYRTGARVSLVRPKAPTPSAVSNPPATP